MSILLLHVKPAQYALWVDIFLSPGTDSWICSELFSVHGFMGYGLVGLGLGLGLVLIRSGFRWETYNNAYLVYLSIMGGK